MSKDMGKLINRKYIILCCWPIFSYNSSLVIVHNVQLSQSLLYIMAKIILSILLEYSMHK